MGIFDFLGDLSSKRGKELGLGGLKSLLGTRGAAEAGLRGDEMMKMTGSDSLPGYFNEQTREYVPWYVDLFDGGGLNAAGGAASAEAAGMPAAGASLLGGGAQPSPNVQPGPALGSQLSDMERLNRMRGVQAQAGPAIGTTIEQPLVDMQNRASINKQPSVQEIMSQPDSNIMLGDLYKGTGRDMPTMPGMDAPLAPQSFLGGAIDAPFAGFPTAGENSLWDRALSGELAESNRAALNGNASTSNPSLPQSQNVGPTEFERFKSKFEKELKENGLWGFPDKIQETFDGLKSRGLNY
tara:strand:+ start:782 stop:1669 length:888 start_codon:yes stop_codon:yes gene_type:complete